MRTNMGWPEVTPNVGRFLIAIIAIFLVSFITKQANIAMNPFQMLTLNPFLCLYSLQLWRLFTYAFLHDLSSPFHVIINCLLLYMIGPQMENLWGSKKFLMFIITAILLGGVFVCISFLLGLSSATVIGFSSVTIGLLIAWGLSFPHHQVYLFGFIPLTGRQTVFITIALEFVYAFLKSDISSAAHFGGITAGFLFSMNIKRIKKRLRR